MKWDEIYYVFILMCSSMKMWSVIPLCVCVFVHRNQIPDCTRGEAASLEKPLPGKYESFWLVEKQKYTDLKHPVNISHIFHFQPK